MVSVALLAASNSCVIKLSKLTKAGKVWRGIKDATLPKEFWVPNEMGVRGGIEYGFSSTTTDKTQALFYAGSDELKDGDASTIFEMQMGMVDRGADLSWLSQYPHEKEVLLPPAYSNACSFSVVVDEKPYSMPPRTPISLGTQNSFGSVASLMPRHTLAALVSLDSLSTQLLIA